ncbi:unnamed protein product [Prorocentrum cordatum]|uniref:DNA (cytosine-5-)-methyltransferase n=1 Tax=Prorocentrum cordatum TaxID=2364126 RepID=A0ABN9V1N4_9DINO|nr:unnamed protein product [Polarella glacialis]
METFKSGLLAMSTEGSVTVGSACSGCDIVNHVFRVLLTHAQRSMAEHVPQVRHVFSREKDPSKIAFLKNEFAPEILFDDVRVLTKRSGVNLMTGKAQRVPGVDILAAGFSCKSRAATNNKSHLHVNCIQNKDPEAETSITFHAIADYIIRFRPRLFFLENVMSLGQKKDGSDDASDMEWICEYFANSGFAMKTFAFDAADFGSPASRRRLYLLGWSMEFESDDSPAAPAMPLDYLDSFLGSLLVEGPDMNSFLIANPDQWESEMAKYTATPALGPSRKEAKKDVEWHKEHCNAFRDADLQWPAEGVDPEGFVDMEFKGVSFKLYKGTLCDRQFELTLFSMVSFPMAEGSPPEFMDVIMPSLGRIFKGEDFAAPWRTQMQTITAAARPVVRFFWKGEVYVRPVGGAECMAIIGWDYSFWNDPDAYKYEDPLLVSLAGSAFSGFAAPPMLMCLFFAQGKFKAAADAKGPSVLNGDEGDEEQGESESADSSSD